MGSVGGRRVLWMLAVSGCAYVWRVDELPPVDAPGIDSAIDAPVCTPSTTLVEDFSTGSACPGWSMAFGTGAQEIVTSGSGSLTLTKSTTGPMGCEANSATAFGDLGYFVAIDQPFTTLGAYTTLSILSSHDMSAHPKWSMTVDGGGLIHFDVNDVPQPSIMYKPAEMRFVRIRPDRPNNAVVGEYSGDAIHWTQLGSDSTTPPTAVYVDLATGESNQPAQTDTAIYSHLDVCP